MASRKKLKILSLISLMIFLFSSLGTSISFAAGPEYENVALNKPVSIPEWDTPRQPPYAPENAVDGIGGVWTNGWEPSKGDGVKPWLQIDLLDEYVIHRIEIDDRPYDGKEGRPEWDAPRKDFEIRASNDPAFETYVVLGSTEGEPFEIPTWVHYVTDTNAYRYIRYVRLYEGWTFLSEIRVFGTKPQLKKVATPVANPGRRFVPEGTEVSITCETEGATIFYTVDGSEPDTVNGILYTGPITVESSMILKAIAVKDGMADSDMLTTKYTVSTPTNVALKKPVTCSAAPDEITGNGPEQAVDGISGIGNGWDSPDKKDRNNWLQIDLGSEYIICRVEYDDRLGDDWVEFRANFQILASNDPTFEEYVILGEVGPEGFENDTTWSQNVTDQTAYRYVRFQKTTNLYAFITEIRVFSILAPPEWLEGSEITTSNISRKGVTLTWPAAVDDVAVTGYRIYKDGVLIATVAGDIHSYDVTGLKTDTTYTFKVEAGNAAGKWSEDGPTVTVTTEKDTVTVSVSVAVNNYTGMVKISGKVSSGQGQEVTVLVINPVGGTDYADQTTSGHDGSYEFLYKTNKNVSGEYTVMVGGTDITKPIVTTFNYAPVEGLVIEVPVFTDAAGNVVEHLIPSTDLRASVAITNNDSEDVDACLILALYDPNGAFKNYSYIEGQVEANQSYIFNAGFMLPSDVEGHYVQVFVWNSMDGMQPLTNVIRFE